MTRGTFILVCEDRVLESAEFNGGMNLEDYGTEAIIMFCQVEKPEEFEGMVAVFNQRYHQYNDEQLVYQKDDFYDGDDVVDFRIQYFDRFFSDYVYLKNLRATPLKMIDRKGREFLVPYSGLVALNFGREISQRVIGEAVEAYYKKNKLSV